MSKILLSSNTTWFLTNYLSSQMRSLKNNGDEVVGSGPADGFEERLAQMGIRFVELPVPRIQINPIAGLAGYSGVSTECTGGNDRILFITSRSSL